MKKSVLVTWLLALTAISMNVQQSDSPKLTGPYRGQKPPGRSSAPMLDEKLSVFKPFISPTWVGSIPNDSRMGEIAMKWEVILNGFAVRLKRNILNSGHYGKRIAFSSDHAGNTDI